MKSIWILTVLVIAICAQADQLSIFPTTRRVSNDGRGVNSGVVSVPAAPSRAVATKTSPRNGRKNNFVLFDRFRTGLPIVHCQLPAGWMAGGKVLWFEGVLQPVRYFVSAYDMRSLDWMTLGSVFCRQPSFEYTPLAKAIELTDPNNVAKFLAQEMSQHYRLRNLRIASATFSERKDAESVKFMQSRVQSARAYGQNCTAIRFFNLHFRYLGERNGRVHAVNCEIPYLLEELNGMSAISTFLSVDSCCCPEDPRHESELKARLAEFSGSRLICGGFENAVKAKIHKRAQRILRDREEILRIFQEVNAYKEEVYHGTTYSWESVIRNTSTLKDKDGNYFLVDGNFDNYRVDLNRNEYVCWNNGDEKAGYNPNNDERVGGGEWRECTKEN